MKDFSIIIAVDNENGIGKCNDLAWSIPEDMKHFKNITSNTQNPNKQNALIMGRKTWESIPKKYRPFKNRKNFILSRGFENGVLNKDEAYEFSDFNTCLSSVSNMTDVEEIFIIGGAQIYNQVLKHPNFTKAYITRIYYKYHCDTFFDGLPLNFNLEFRSEMKEYQGVEFEYSVYRKKIGILEKIKKVFKK